MVTEMIRSPKAVGTELTQLENRLETVKEEVKKKTEMRDALQADIDKRTNDFGMYINQRDSEAKNMRRDLLAEKEEFNKQKSEFHEILTKHSESKVSLENEKRELEIQKLKFEATTKNVGEFIQAVRRSVGLLGI